MWGGTLRLLMRGSGASGCTARLHVRATSVHGSQAIRQRVILIVHLLLNPITLPDVDVSCLLGGLVDIQTHLFAVLPLDELAIAFNAQQFSLDRLAAFGEPTKHNTDDVGNRYHERLLG